MTSGSWANSTRRRARWRRGLRLWSGCSTPRRRAVRAREGEMWTDSRHRLYRDPENGVLAGIADYLGAERIVIRLAFVLALFLFIVPAVLAYILLTIALPKRPPALYASGEEAAFWRGVTTAPDDTLAALRRRFADLEARLQAMEREVTSGEADLRRKFRDLGD